MKKQLMGAVVASMVTVGAIGTIEAIQIQNETSFISKLSTASEDADADAIVINTDSRRFFINVSIEIDMSGGTRVRTTIGGQVWDYTVPADGFTKDTEQSIEFIAEEDWPDVTAPEIPTFTYYDKTSRGEWIEGGITTKSTVEVIKAVHPAEEPIIIKTDVEEVTMTGVIATQNTPQIAENTIITATINGAEFTHVVANVDQWFDREHDAVFTRTPGQTMVPSAEAVTPILLVDGSDKYQLETHTTFIIEDEQDTAADITAEATSATGVKITTPIVEETTYTLTLNAGSTEITSSSIKATKKMVRNGYLEFTTTSELTDGVLYTAVLTADNTDETFNVSEEFKYDAPTAADITAEATSATEVKITTTIVEDTTYTLALNGGSTEITSSSIKATEEMASNGYLAFTTSALTDQVLYTATLTADSDETFNVSEEFKYDAPATAVNITAEATSATEVKITTTIVENTTYMLVLNEGSNTITSTDITATEEMVTNGYLEFTTTTDLTSAVDYTTTLTTDTDETFKTTTVRYTNTPIIPNDDSNGFSDWEIAGIVIGSLAVVGLIAGGGYYFYTTKKSS